MDEKQLKEHIIDKYKEKYKSELENYKVDLIVYNTFGGEAAVVSYDEGLRRESEICFIGENYEVQIFDSTPELLKTLEQKSKRGLIRVFDRSVFTGIALFILILATACVGIRSPQSEALPILGSALALATGFFFSNKKEA